MNWANEVPARCIYREPEGSNRRRAGTRRRRLGLAGSPGWPFIRTHAAMWILFYFGGMAGQDGCWYSTRGESGTGYNHSVYRFHMDRGRAVCEKAP